MDTPALPEIVRDWVETAQRHPEVRGIALTGSTARGDGWPGSDIDLYVLWSEERRAELPGLFMIGDDRYADVHHLPVTELRRMQMDQAAFAASIAVDECAGGLPLHDPDGLLHRWVATIADRLARPDVWRARGAARLAEATGVLEAACRSADAFESAMLVRDAGRLTAYAYVVGRGGLISSARRFPERFCAKAQAGVAAAFYRVWGLGGGRPGVEAAIAGLRRTIRHTLAAYAQHPPLPGEPGWAGAYRAATADGREAMIAEHPLPLLVEPAVAHGFHDGALLWMRGFYNWRLGEILGPLPRPQWPIADLEAFHGLMGDEEQQCRDFLAQVHGALR